MYIHYSKYLPIMLVIIVCINIFSLDENKFKVNIFMLMAESILTLYCKITYHLFTIIAITFLQYTDKYNEMAKINKVGALVNMIEIVKNIRYDCW